MSFLAQLFGGQQPQQPQQQQMPTQQAPTNPQQNPQQQATQSQQNTQNQVPQAFEGTPSAQGSPLDEFAKIFDTKNTEGKQQGPQSLFNYDPDKMSETINGINFADSIDPEMAQKALQGDAQAFFDVLNSVGRNVFSQSVNLNTKMVDSGFNTGLQRFESSLPKKIRDLNLGQHVQQQEPFNHPAVKPLMNVLHRQFAEQYPDSSSEQITSMVKKYLGQVAAVTNPPQNDQSQSPNPFAEQESDFSNFFR